jgi:hypothetical protein
VREGKFEAAARYAFTPEDKARIERFANAQAARDNTKLPLNARARAAIEAATIRSNEGMQLQGADLGPDFASLDGNYEIGGSTPSDLASADERKRATASAVVPAVRFHYRQLAAEELLEFAKGLPARTTLKTAVLCAGAGLARHGAGDRKALVQKFYREYQRQGLPYKGDWNFGEGCPEI